MVDVPLIQRPRGKVINTDPVDEGSDPQNNAADCNRFNNQEQTHKGTLLSASARPHPLPKGSLGR